MERLPAGMLAELREAAGRGSMLFLERLLAGMLAELRETAGRGSMLFLERLLPTAESRGQQSERVLAVVDPVVAREGPKPLAADRWLRFEPLAADQGSGSAGFADHFFLAAAWASWASCMAIWRATE